MKARDLEGHILCCLRSYVNGVFFPERQSQVMTQSRNFYTERYIHPMFDSWVLGSFGG